MRHISEREQLLVEIANYMLDNGSTVRYTAKVFGYSKSAIHHMMTVQLYDYGLYNYYNRMRDLFDYNKSVRAIHGGESTRRKYEALRGQN